MQDVTLDNVKKTPDEILKIREFARENIKNKQESEKKKYDLKHRPVDYCAGNSQDLYSQTRNRQER